jgi:hypothetical protein
MDCGHRDVSSRAESYVGKDRRHDATEEIQQIVATYGSKRAVGPEPDSPADDLGHAGASASAPAAKFRRDALLILVVAVTVPTAAAVLMAFLVLVGVMSWNAYVAAIGVLVLLFVFGAPLGVASAWWQSEKATMRFRYVRDRAFRQGFGAACVLAAAVALGWYILTAPSADETDARRAALSACAQTADCLALARQFHGGDVGSYLPSARRGTAR